MTRHEFNTAYWNAFSTALRDAASRSAAYVQCAASRHLARAARSIDRHGHTACAQGV
jgi:hypothetical protein